MALIIKIKENQLTFIKASTKPEGRYHVDACFSIPYEINSQESNAHVHQEIITIMKNHRIKERKTHVVLCSSLTLSKEFELPQLEEKRLKPIIQNEMTLAMNLTDDYIFDYLILGEIENREYLTDRVLVVGLKVEIMKRIETLMKGLKLRIQSVQTIDSTTLNLVDFTDIPLGNKPTLLLNLENDKGSFYCYHQQEVLMLRNITWRLNEEPSPIKHIETIVRECTAVIESKFSLDVKDILVFGDENFCEAYCKSQAVEHIIHTVVPLDSVLTDSSKIEDLVLSALGALS